MLIVLKKITSSLFVCTGIVAIDFTEGTAIAIALAISAAGSEAGLVQVFGGLNLLIEAESCNDNNAHEKHCYQLVGHNVSLN